MFHFIFVFFKTSSTCACTFSIKFTFFPYFSSICPLISSYPIGTSEIWCNHGNWQGKLECASKDQYGDGVMMSFEGTPVRVPEKYDEYLTQKYGDWRADLPEDKQKGHHYYSIMDLKKSYTEYMWLELKTKILLTKKKVGNAVGCIPVHRHWNECLLAYKL